MNMNKVAQTVITKSIDIEFNKNKVIVSFLSGGSSSILSGAAIRDLKTGSNQVGSDYPGRCRGIIHRTCLALS